MGNLIRGKILPIEGDYNPYDYRKVHSSTTKNQAFILILKGILGSGILAMPLAFKYSGWLFGIIATLLLVLIVIHGIHMLIESSYALCQREKVPLLTYPLTLKHACKDGPIALRWLSPISGPLVNIFLIANQVGVGSVYIIFIANNIKDVIDANTSFHVDLRVHITFYIIPILILITIRHLRHVAIVSQIGNCLLFIALGIILYFVFVEFPSLEGRRPFGRVLDYPLYISIAVFALQSVGVMVSISENMDKPSDFLGWFGVMSIATFTASILYIIIGLFGYLKYGDDIKSVITLNLPQGNPLAQSVRIIYSVVIFFSYAIQMFVPFEIIWYQYWQKYFPRKELHIYYEYLTKIFLTTLAFIFAVVIPDIAVFMGLKAALCLSALCFIFPGTIQLCTLYPNKYGKYNFTFYKDILFIIFGILILILGTTTSIIAIIDLYK